MFGHLLNRSIGTLVRNLQLKNALLTFYNSIQLSNKPLRIKVIPVYPNALSTLVTELDSENKSTGMEVNLSHPEKQYEMSDNFGLFLNKPLGIEVNSPHPAKQNEALDSAILSLNRSDGIEVILVKSKASLTFSKLVSPLNRSDGMVSIIEPLKRPSTDTNLVHLENRSDGMVIIVL